MFSCVHCDFVCSDTEFKENLSVCPSCAYHFRVTARNRLDDFLDPKGRVEIGSQLVSVDMYDFHDTRSYKDRLKEARDETNETDAVIVMAGQLLGLPVVTAAFEFDFMAGTIGSVVGERIVLAVNHALQHGSPFIVFCTSGGARMQESFYSLYQVAKICAALGSLADARLPLISVLTDPTMGGLTASIGMLGDINIGEPGALIGFAGPRVIQQIVHQTLPPGFQRSEFLLQHGSIDMISDRRELRLTISSLLSLIHSDRK